MLFCGYVFGMVGCLVLQPGYNVGSWAGFFVGRYMCRTKVLQKSESNKYCKAFYAAIQVSGLKKVTLINFAPIPLAPLVFFLGSTELPFHLFASGMVRYLRSNSTTFINTPFLCSVRQFIGQIPLLILAIYAGSIMGTLSQLEGGVMENQALVAGMAGGAVVLVGLVAWITIEARKQLDIIVESVGDDSREDNHPTGANEVLPETADINTGLPSDVVHSLSND